MSNSDSLNSKCRIIVDAMGGDYAPQNAVLGAVQAFEEKKDFELFLIGKEKEILRVLSENKASFPKENIIHAEEVIEMGDSKPTAAIKSKPKSSIVAGMTLVKDKKADAFVSAGNTGAVMAAATLIMGRIEGVGRPTMGAPMPNTTGVCTLFDVGSSVDSKPKHLLEYAIMGTIYTKEIFGIDNPSIGILSVGEEESKGSEVSLAACELIKKTNLNFKGNVEGGDILKGTVNVVICDGFVGNILLKFGEGVIPLLRFKFTEYAKKGLTNLIKIAIAKNAMKEVMKDFDYQEQGGVPLLGVNGICMIGHGRSTPKAIKNLVFRADYMYKKNLIKKFESSIKQYSHL
jgi:glycerol-3-phosphate acyltransferase PlsX